MFVFIRHNLSRQEGRAEQALFCAESPRVALLRSCAPEHGAARSSGAATRRALTRPVLCWAALRAGGAGPGPGRVLH